MEFDPPKEELSHFRNRVRAVESRRKAASFYLVITIPSAALALVLLIASLVTTLSCLLTIVGIILVGVAVGSFYMWFQLKQAEEFEEKRRRDRIREMNGPGKCMYLDGSIPDGSGKIGKCILYGFTLDDLPYCIYCREYRTKQANQF